jgi:hypothetical protein
MVEINVGERIPQPLAFFSDRPVDDCLLWQEKPDREGAHLEGAAITEATPGAAEASER